MSARAKFERFRLFRLGKRIEYLADEALWRHDREEWYRQLARLDVIVDRLAEKGCDFYSMTGPGELGRALAVYASAC